MIDADFNFLAQQAQQQYACHGNRCIGRLGQTWFVQCVYMLPLSRLTEIYRQRTRSTDLGLDDQGLSRTQSTSS